MSILTFSLIAQLNKEIKDFYEKDILIATTVKKEGSLRYVGAKKAGYYFNQMSTLNTIELYDNSKYENGDIDKDGQRKLFLNIVNFIRKVASKNTDIDLKNFLFLPEDYSGFWIADFARREFKMWAKKNYFSELINDCVDDYPKYGSLVLKEVKGKLELINLNTLINQQDADSLNEATFVIEEHKDMTLPEMRKFKDWNLDGLDQSFGKTYTVYERRGHVPLDWFNAHNGRPVEKDDCNKSIDTVSFLVKDVKKGAKSDVGNILFIEKITKRPYQEVHWERVKGRWLGRGEVENQIENQIAKNVGINLKKKSMFWSSKKVFQSSDVDVAKNLLKDVKDGDVIKILPNGNITQVALANQAQADFQSFANEWDQNTQQKSFTFESATGESMGSNTPFRLGAMLQNSVQSYFNLKKQKLGLFFKRVIEELIYPVFQSENSAEHLLNVYDTDEGFEVLKQITVKVEADKEYKRVLLSGQNPDYETIKAKVGETISKRKVLDYVLKKDFYKDLKGKVLLTITGEEIDLPKKIETFTNLYQTLMGKGDVQRADKIMNKILTLAGENPEAVLGPVTATPAQPETMGQPGQPGAAPTMPGIGGTKPEMATQNI
jgi:hypothetical protein